MLSCATVAEVQNSIEVEQLKLRPSNSNEYRTSQLTSLVSALNPDSQGFKMKIRF